MASLQPKCVPVAELPEDAEKQYQTATGDSLSEKGCSKLAGKQEEENTGLKIGNNKTNQSNLKQISSSSTNMRLNYEVLAPPLADKTSRFEEQETNELSATNSVQDHSPSEPLSASVVCTNLSHEANAACVTGISPQRKVSTSDQTPLTPVEGYQYSNFKHLEGARLQDCGLRTYGINQRFSGAGYAGVQISQMERELGMCVRTEDGAIDLRRAREAQRWNNSCLSCRLKAREISVVPCGHETICRHCFLDPYFEPYSVCPLCGQSYQGLQFSQELQSFFLSRSNMQ